MKLPVSSHGAILITLEGAKEGILSICILLNFQIISATLDTAGFFLPHTLETSRYSNFSGGGTKGFYFNPNSSSWSSETLTSNRNMFFWFHLPGECISVKEGWWPPRTSCFQLPLKLMIPQLRRKSPPKGKKCCLQTICFLLYIYIYISSAE